MFLQGSKNSLYKLGKFSLREKCPNTEFFLVRIQSECSKIRTRKNSVSGHFSRSVFLERCLSMKAEYYFVLKKIVCHVLKPGPRGVLLKMLSVTSRKLLLQNTSGALHRLH